MTRASKKIASEIERYCAAHPDAGDTLDGIAWWLMQQRYDDARAEVEAAVDSLVQRGILVRRQLAGGATLLCCASGRRPYLND